MESSRNIDIRKYAVRLTKARMKLLYDNGFYGLLAMHVDFKLGNRLETAWIEETGDKDIVFLNPDFLDMLGDGELYYVLMHLVMHICLDHMNRSRLKGSECFDEAADIVVNSNIIHSMSDDEYVTNLENFGGIQEHIAPNGEEGYKYSVEELCDMLVLAGHGNATGKIDMTLESVSAQGVVNNEKLDRNKTEGDPEAESDGNPGAGNKGKGDGVDSGGEQLEENRSDKAKDNDANNDVKESDSSDINSDMKGRKSPSGWDYHDRNSSNSKLNISDQKWKSYIISACETMEKRIKNGSASCGSIPEFAARFVERIKNPILDWRSILNDFIQMEICDYSFTPPDRRFADSPFFLPDYNETEDKVEKILFMIDTSGSMSDKNVTECYSEIKGAIDQFNGRLEGWLGFFDARVTPPEAFKDEEEFEMIRVMGGGGTSFYPIFDYVRNEMSDDFPVSIIILTDGYVAKYPDEEEAMDIPVLWIINNDKVTPPWGKVARLLI